MKRSFVWIYMFQKRLLRRAGFLIILAVIPVLVVGMSVSAKKDGSLLTVGLCTETPEDPVAAGAIKTITEDDSILRFQIYEDPTDAREAVESGLIDAAWIFPNDLSQRIEDFVKAGYEGHLVTVIEQEESVPTALSHEKLYGALFPYISRNIYHDFIRDGLLTETEATEKVLEQYYSRTMDLGSLVESEHLDGSSIRQENYLLIPLRGLLNLLILLCGFAGMMYHMQDVHAGVYDWLPEHKRLLPAIGNVFAATADAALAALIALLCAGLIRSFAEIAAMLLFILCGTAFCLLVGALCKKETVLGAVAPILLMAMLAICPIFLNFGVLRPLQVLFPPFYYLYAISDLRYLGFMLLYGMILFGAFFGFEYFTTMKMKKRR